ncbi:unnamed protein product [Symbiodinium microadriaticum]|nr:unnamed protein product [Symbiodinium microadriaticum]CAE7942452.1 unnamed protein product [Symbiodinium sp. KB8]
MSWRPSAGTCTKRSVGEDTFSFCRKQTGKQSVYPSLCGSPATIRRRSSGYCKLSMSCTQGLRREALHRPHSSSSTDLR